MARRVSGLRSLWIAVVASAGIVCVLSAQTPDPRARFAGTWQIDDARSVEDRVDWRRLDQPIARRIPCIDPPQRQENMLVSPGYPYYGWRECYDEGAEDNRRRQMNVPPLRRPTTDVLTSSLGGRLMRVLPELHTRTIGTGAVITGAPDEGPIGFPTTGVKTTLTFGGRSVHVSAAWRDGDLVQLLSAKDNEIDFQVRRTFATSPDGLSLTVTTRVEKPKLHPVVKDVVHVFTRSR